MTPTRLSRMEFQMQEQLEDLLRDLRMVQTTVDQGYYAQASVSLAGFNKNVAALIYILTMQQAYTGISVAGEATDPPDAPR